MHKSFKFWCCPIYLVFLLLLLLLVSWESIVKSMFSSGTFDSFSSFIHSNFWIQCEVRTQCWHPGQISFDHMCEGLLGFHFIPFHVFVVMPGPHCFDDHSFVVSFKIRTYEFSNFFLKIVFVIWGRLQFRVNLSVVFSISTKKGRWNFDRDFIAFVDCFG